jgi:hypothetical protein
MRLPNWHGGEIDFFIIYEVSCDLNVFKCGFLLHLGDNRMGETINGLLRVLQGAIFCLFVRAVGSHSW